MAKVDISADSTEYVRVKIAAKENGVTVDPTSDTVEMAFVTSKDAAPEDEEWGTASWETAGSTYYARALVGPLGVQALIAGATYRVWVRWTDGDEKPVKALSYLYAY